MRGQHSNQRGLLDQGDLDDLVGQVVLQFLELKRHWSIVLVILVLQRLHLGQGLHFGQGLRVLHTTTADNHGNGSIELGLHGCQMVQCCDSVGDSLRSVLRIEEEQPWRWPPIEK